MNLLLLIGALALTIAVLEVGLRLFGEPPPSSEDSLSAFTEYDPLLGWRGRPGVASHFRFRGTRIDVRHNRGGWRDEEVDAAPPAAPAPAAPGTAPARVLLLGDSYAWGFGVEQRDRFDDRVERLLAGCRVQNYGVSGYGTDQELLVLRQVAAEARPDLVLVAFAVGNDLWNNLATEAYRLPKPRFRPGPEALRLENVPVPRVGDWDRRANTGVRDFLTEHLRLFAWVRTRWAAVKPGFRRWMGRPMRSVPAEERIRILSTAVPADPLVEEGWILAGRLLAAIREEAAAAGSRLAVLVVPDPVQVDEALWRSAVAELRLDPVAFDRDRPNAMLARLGREQGFEVVDPLAAMRRHAAEGARLFLPGDPHWSPDGHRVAAEVLAEALRR